MTLIANYEVQDFIAVFDASTTSAYATGGSYPFGADVTWDANRNAKVSVVKQSDGSLVKGTNSVPVVRNRVNSGVLATLSGVFQNGYNTAEIAWQYQFSTKGFTTAVFTADMAAKNAATKNWKAQISTDGTTFSDLGDAWDVTANVLTPLSFTLPDDAIDKDLVIVRIMGTGDVLLSDKYAFDAGTSEEGLAYATNSESQVGNVYILGEAQVEEDTQAPVVTGTVPADNATGASASGKITVSFDERIESAGSTGSVTLVLQGALGGQTLTPTWNSRSVSFDYKGLEYDKISVSVSDKEVKEEKGDESSELEIVIIADRGYVSEKNIKELRDAEIGYILLLKKNMIIADEILQNHLHEVKKPGNYLNDSGKFALTVPGKLFEDDEGDSYFHIVWDGKLETAHRYMLMNAIEAKEQRLRKAVERKTRYTEFEIDSFKEFFFLQYHQEGRLKVNMHGRGAGKKKEIPSYVIDSFARNNEAIEEADRKCGYLVYVTHRQMTAKETLQAVSKRDCVEKTFRALKGWMGMDKFGVHSESSMHSKNLIWFVASIIRSLIFTNTENARTKDKKRYTLPAIIDQLEEIRADKELSTGQYQRRYKPTKIQSNCLQMLGIKLDSIDEIIAALGQEAIVDDL